jgi:hypothetical protein
MLKLWEISNGPIGRQDRPQSRHFSMVTCLRNVWRALKRSLPRAPRRFLRLLLKNRPKIQVKRRQRHRRRHRPQRSQPRSRRKWRRKSQARQQRYLTRPHQRRKHISRVPSNRHRSQKRTHQVPANPKPRLMGHLVPAAYRAYPTTAAPLPHHISVHRMEIIR